MNFRQVLEMLAYVGLVRVIGGLAELIQFQIWQPEGWSKSLKKT